MKAYLAGPGVFRPDAIAHGQALVERCRQAGLVGLYPLDAELDLSGLSPSAAGAAIRDANMELIREADILIADVSPFRGPSLDSGTAYELGVAAALGKPVFAYGWDGTDYKSRMLSMGLCGVPEADAACLDAEGMSVENFGLFDNLMMGAGVHSLSLTFEEALVHAVEYARASMALSL